MEEINNSMPKLSIITINLNDAIGLEKTILSIVNQNFVDFELIVIDGGSVDGSVEVIKKYVHKITYWQSESDNGIYHAMNKGIAKARGEYCFFLNSRDYLVNQKVLENLFVNDLKEDVIFGNLLIVDHEQNVIGKAKGKDDITFIDVYNNLIKHQASFIKKDLFNKFGFYNEKLRIIADWEFLLRTIFHANCSVKYFDIDISCYDNHGISSTNTTKNYIQIWTREKNEIINQYIPYILQKDILLFSGLSKYQFLFYNKFTLLIIKLLFKIFKK